MWRSRQCNLDLVSPVFTTSMQISYNSDVVGFNVNIKDLYHGTTAPLDQICAEGLDPRVSVHGHFGRGIYFRFVGLNSTARFCVIVR